MNDGRMAIACVAWIGVLLPACGGEATPPAAAPANAPGEPSSVTAAPEGPFTPVGTLSAAAAQLERAEEDLAASANDCAVACRALASMRRAAEQLCALSETSDDARRCDEAKRRVATAQDRVVRACGRCAGD
jgi:hypothetical protein